MQQQVTVTGLDGPDAIVQGKRASACGNCAGKTSCSTMGSWVERFVELRVKNTLDVRIGDRIILDVPDSAVMKIAFRLYALPMLVFVLAGLGMRNLALWMDWAEFEAIAALAGFAAVIVYYLCYKIYLSGHQSGMDVQMKQRIHAAPQHGSEHNIPLQVWSSSR